MGTTALKQLLKSLCKNSHWNYAVLWKIKYHNRAILAWEDGYCDCAKLEKLMGSMTEDVFQTGNDKNISSSHGTSIQNGDYGSYSVGPAVADMSYLQYALGEGTVGRVADSGNHSWILLENIFTSDVFSNLISKCPSELLIQYASGIKTILLAPVLPLGVLQLGSLQMVAEDLSMIAYIKDRFRALHSVDGNAISVTSDKVVWTCSASVLVSSLFEDLDEQSTLSTNMLEVENYDAIDDVKPPLSTSNQFVTVQDVLSASRQIRPETLHCGKGHKCDIQAINLKEQFAPLNQSISASEVEMGDGNLFELFSLETQSPTCTQLRNHDYGLFEGNDLGVHSYSADNMVKQQLGHNFVTKKEYGSADNFFSFPDVCELRKVLGPAFQGQKQTNEFLYESSGSIKDTTSSLMCNRDFNEGDIEHLLEAMIANLYDNSDNTLSNNTVNAITASMSGKFAHSVRQCCQSELSAIMVDESAPWIFPESAVIDIGRKNFTSLSTLNSLVINEQEEKHCDITQPRKGIKKFNSNRRTRLTANPRQRPRDRQLIQDRIKELREIVPNGAKCSIDGLLEKTIMHMRYLRRVTDQAEKLKQLVQQEDTDSKNCTALENVVSRQNGASWAFDIGSELQVCPIVVEDLEYPGHMLIEMLCNDMGLFLEIAQVIRHLELTILKGVIEHHSDNSWAHFIVEELFEHLQTTLGLISSLRHTLLFKPKNVNLNIRLKIFVVDFCAGSKGLS